MWTHAVGDDVAVGAVQGKHLVGAQHAREDHEVVKIAVEWRGAREKIRSNLGRINAART